MGLCLGARGKCGSGYADLIASYTFDLPPDAPASVPGLAKDGGKNVKMKDGKEKSVSLSPQPEYNPCGWRAWLNNTTISLGMQNVSTKTRRLWPALSRTATTNRLPRSKAGLVRPAKEKV